MDDPIEQPSSQAIAGAVAQVLERNSIAALATLVAAAEGVGAKLLVDDAGRRTGSLCDSRLDDAVASFTANFLNSRAEARTFQLAELITEQPLSQPDARILFERIEPEPRLVICGAGHVGAALARLALLIGYRTLLIDDRADFVRRDLFPDEGIELVAASNWKDAVSACVGNGRNVAVTVVTRGHNEDEQCLQAVMSARPDYVGLIGSKRRTNIVLERLRAAGADERDLREVRAPVGLDLGAVSPQEVALSILAEIVAERRGGTGLPLSAWRRPRAD